MSEKEAAREKIAVLIQQYYAMSATELSHISEAGVVHQFLDPFFAALGWPINDPVRYKYELNTETGRPDMVLLPEKGGTLFIEAKRFGLIKELAQTRKSIEGIIKPHQLALPGMATDRTKEEQQAINYAFENGGTWAILTNFEKLRLFNARRDWLVLSFERPAVYLDEFDLLWQLSYPQIEADSLDLLSNQRHHVDIDNDYLDFINDWRERLAQNILAQPERNLWVFDEQGQVKLAELRAVVQRIIDRLVVIRFAEDHFIVPPGTLHEMYLLRKKNRYITLSEMLRLFFRGFDQFHNSALFAPDLADHAVVSEPLLLALMEKLYEARYRSMPADIMGNTYEQYLGKTLILVDGQVKTSDNLETRKKQGSYYTPQVMVQYIVDQALGRYLYGTVNGRADGAPLPDGQPKQSHELRTLRVLDPSCGSGSFLIYAYEVLANFYRRELHRLQQEREARLVELEQLGTSPFDIRIELAPYTGELYRLEDYPRLILEQHLYGVDLDPQAAEIATVNMMMQAMAEQNRTSKHLPLILNQNIKVGNALIGAILDQAQFDSLTPEQQTALTEIYRLRIQATQEDTIHAVTWEKIAQLTQQLLQELPHDPQLNAAHPLHWLIEFPEVYVTLPRAKRPPPQGGNFPSLDVGGGRVGVANWLGEAAGFTVIVGNPPWEILKPDLREFYAKFDPKIESQYTRAQAEKRIAEINVTNPQRQTEWLEQKELLEISARYYREYYRYQDGGDTATHKLFVERTYTLLRSGGHLGLVIPSGIYTDLGTKLLRQMLLTQGNIQTLVSLTNGAVGGFAYFPAIHRSFKITLLNAQKGVIRDSFLAVFKTDPRSVPKPDDLPPLLAETSHFLPMTIETIKRFSPHSLNIMEFRNQQDYLITEKIYATHPTLGEKLADSWNLQFTSELHMTNARQLFNQHQVGLPLYEGKMINHFNAYFAKPNYWIEETKGRKYLLRRKEDTGQILNYQQYRLGIRAIARTTDERTLIAAMLPPKTGASNSLLVVPDLPPRESLYLLAVFNSLVLDYILRLKIASNVSMFYLYQLPVPRLTVDNPTFQYLMSRAARLTCTTPAFAELWQGVMGEAWHEGVGVTDLLARQQLRHEIDALVAHLYGLSQSEFEHILNTFPLVFPPTPDGEAKKFALLTAYEQTQGQPL